MFTRTFRSLHALCSLILICLPSTATRSVSADDKGDFQRLVKPFLKQFCLECHNQKKSEADFLVEDLDGPIKAGKDTVRFEKILEMVSLGHMPPEDAKQPDAGTRRQLTKWISDELSSIGRGLNQDKLLLPSQANRVNHEELFSGKHLGPAYTPARRWRKSPQIYQQFANEMRAQISQPLQGLGGKGIQDYASLLADEATIQTMLRNSNLIADRLMNVDRAPLNYLFKKDKAPEQKEIDQAIDRLFQMIFQRKPTAADRQKYVERLFQKNRELAGLKTAMRTLIVGMLMSQEFVFRLEVGLGESLADGRRMLGPMELAYAISFAFFDKPDRSLIEAAEKGQLVTRKDVEREVRRLLNRSDEQQRYRSYPMYHMWGRDYYSFNPRVLRFFQEFFGYSSAADVFKDRERNPDHHARRLRKDADFLVIQILQKDKDVLKELLTTRRYPMDPLRLHQIDQALNDPNNRFYKSIRSRFGDRDFESILRQGLWPGVQSRHVSAYNLTGQRAEDVRRKPGDPVEFPAHERAGMLTHPAWLVAHSGNFDNDPIRRGKWIRERLLADLVPDIPIGVDAKIPDDPHRTLRERLEVVRPAECWRCHKLMNPLGEVFEAYDDFGSYRKQIVVGDADGYRKAKRKYDGDVQRTLEDLARWKKLDAKRRAAKVDEAKDKLKSLVKPDQSMKNYSAQLRRYENDLKRWTGEQKKWAEMTDAQQQREIERLQKRLDELEPPIPEARPVDTSGELRGTRDSKLDGPVTDAIDLVHRLARSQRVRQSFVRHAFRFWMGRNETLNDSPTLMSADRAYVENEGSFKELLVSLLTSDSFLIENPSQLQKHQANQSDENSSKTTGNLSFSTNRSRQHSMHEVEMTTQSKQTIRELRREFLKKTGLGSLALAPFMNQLQVEAAGNLNAIPKRFVFVVKSNGLRPYGVVPQGLEAYGKSGFRNEKLLDEPLAQKSFQEGMKSLEPFKDQVSVIQGLSSKICKGPHGGHFGVLGAYTSGDHAPPRRETLDVTLAKKFPGIFPQLAFHIGTKPEDQIKYLDISAKGKNSRTPAYASPKLAYKDIFGTVLTGGKEKLEADANQNLMDFLIDDVKQAKKSLGSREKEKLDHYLQGFEALRERQAKLTDRKGSLAKHAPPMDNKYSSPIETHRLEAHFDLAAAALITGLTQAITIRADDLDVRYQGFDHNRMKDISVHEIGHTADVEGTTDRYDSNWRQGRDMRSKIRTYQFELIAGLAAKLKAVPEGDGTMLDNTLIVYFSDAGSQHHTGYDNMPTVVVGNMRGSFKTGRYLHYPDYNKPGHRTFANLLTSILHAAEIPVDRFGDPDRGLSEEIDQDGPLSQWLVS